MASIMVLLMAGIQAFYGVFAFVDPVTFSGLRGTALLSELDADWVVIYGSRTLFVALIISWLLLKREYKLLMWAAIFGTVMPLTDAWLAFQAGASNAVISKHLATFIYLLLTFFLLKRVTQKVQ